MARVFLVCLLSVAVVGFTSAVPAIQDGPRRLDNSVETMRSACNDDSDAFSCLKFKVINFLDSLFKKDRFEITSEVEVQRNGVGNDFTGRSSDSLMDKMEQFVRQHDVTVKIPGSDAKVTLSGRDLDSNDFSLKVKLQDSQKSVGESRKSKIRKIIVPIVVFILLKAITLIPMALGILGIKAWNALQLSFFSFVISTALAIFQLCKKITTDGFIHPHQIAAHGPWDHRRSYEAANAAEESQNLAYSAYL
ncbi:uncharacterized protein LOC132257852 [Phlebotomus argentipes]|uniref:uncharacterized protein LOC132257852 n=1 Tax=Phlebotomus argentipes TaxID=94469 RepID=UPI0028933182|nr:uncharacterized protein LOC132257852 [Phlebotomus argentipes]